MRGLRLVLVLVVLGAVFAVGCGGSPVGPSVVPVIAAIPGPVPAGGPVVAVDAPAEGAAGVVSVEWVRSQYEARPTVANGLRAAVSVLVAVWVTPYADGHPLFFSAQRLFSLVDATLAAGESRAFVGSTPEGCGVLWQTDIYLGVTVADVDSGRVDIRPGVAIPLSYWMGKSRVACPVVVPPVVPPARPEPKPPVVVPPVVVTPVPPVDPPVVTPEVIIPCMPGTVCSVGQLGVR